MDGLGDQEGEALPTQHRFLVVVAEVDQSRRIWHRKVEIPCEEGTIVILHQDEKGGVVLKEGVEREAVVWAGRLCDPLGKSRDPENLVVGDVGGEVVECEKVHDGDGEEGALGPKVGVSTVRVDLVLVEHEEGRGVVFHAVLGH